MKRSILMQICLALLVFAGAAKVQASVIGFGELGLGPQGDGFDLAQPRTINSVIFSFSGSSACLGCALGLPPEFSLVNLSDPVLRGSTSGTLTVVFGTPTPILEFSAAFLTDSSVTDAVHVRLFSGGLESLQDLSLDPVNFFAEGIFRYNGAALDRAEITFSDAASDFALDNVTYATPTTSAATPEPGTIWLSVLGVALFGAGRLGRRIRRPS